MSSRRLLDRSGFRRCAYLAAICVGAVWIGLASSGVTIYPVKLVRDKTLGPQTRLFLLTYYRGGSTFLGKFFSSNPNTFYWFEPLHVYNVELCWAHKGDREIQEPVDTLVQTLTCQVSNISNRVLDERFFGQHMHDLGKLNVFKACEYLNFAMRAALLTLRPTCAQHLENICRENRIVATKEFRLPVHLLPEVISRVPDVKIVYYVRDPRGIMSSRNKLHGYDLDHFKAQVKYLCNCMSQDVESFAKLYSNNTDTVMLLKYEDLAQNPIESAKVLYNFIGEEMPDDVLSWIRAHTESDRADGSYGVRRNSSQAATNWKHELTVDQRDLINEECGHVLDSLDYQ